MTPLHRQFTVILSPQLAAIAVGGAVTYPTLLMEQFQANDTTIQLDMDTKSWIGSIYGLAGIPAIMMPFITQRIGRKWGYIITCLCLMLGWISSYRAITIAELLISESIHGLSTHSLLPVSFIGMTEMLAPKYRAPSMLSFGISQGIGMTACGILSRYLHYKTISLIMLVPTVLAVAIALTWPESPSWFACKGQFDNCEREFIKLRGTEDLSKQELLELITAQKENLTSTRDEAINLRSFWKMVSSRDFYTPSVHTLVVFLMVYWGGVDYIYVYFIEIVSRSSNNNDATFYGTICMYLIVLAGSFVTNVLISKCQYKTLLSYSACGVTICLLISSLISGLQTLGVLSKDSLFIMFSLIAYTACSSVGFHGIPFIISSELMPVKYRSLGGALYIIVNCVMFTASMKFSPYITLHLGLWCTFLIYAINVIICLWFIRKYVPETKGRSLQDIEDFYVYGRFIQRDRDGKFLCGNNLLPASFE